MVFGSNTLPHPGAPLDCADPGPKPHLTPPQSTPHYPNPSPRTRRSRKPSSRCSVSPFSPQPPPPRAPLDCLDPGSKPRLSPPQSTPHYLNSSPRTRRSRKPSSHCSVSVFSPQPPPPRAPLDHVDPGPKPHFAPPQSTSHYPNPSPRAHRSPKLSPSGSIFGF
jgi:hypothetical protein